MSTTTTLVSDGEETFVVRKLKMIRFNLESEQEMTHLKSQIGKEVPLSHYYLRGQKPTLVAIDGNVCMLRYPNGATMRDVPLKDLVDDAGYWRKN